MSLIFGQVEKRLAQKIKLITNFTTSRPAKQTIVIHMMPNISRRKRDHTSKFDQLIEYNMRNIFLEKSYTKCGGETNAKLDHISGSIVPSFMQFVFIVCQVDGYQNILRLSYRPLALTLNKAFQKI